MVKPLMRKYTAITVMAGRFLSALSWCCRSVSANCRAVEWSAAHRCAVLWQMAFVVVMVTFVAYLLNTWALRHVEAERGGHLHLPATHPGHGVHLVTVSCLRLAQSVARPTTLASAGSSGYVPALIFLGVHLVGRADGRRSLETLEQST